MCEEYGCYTGCLFSNNVCYGDVTKNYCKAHNAHWCTGSGGAGGDKPKPEVKPEPIPVKPPVKPPGGNSSQMCEEYGC